MLTEKQRQTFVAKFRTIKKKLDDAKKHAEQMVTKARGIAGPYGAIMDAETLEPLRAATEQEVNASLAAAGEHDPVGPIIVDGREVFAVPPQLLTDPQLLT
jgi:hypothetical protein